MKRWLVESGDIREIVEAASAQEAMSNVFTLFDNDDDPPEPGHFISAIEVIGEELFWKSEDAIKAAGRWACTGANTAEKPSS